MDINLNIEKLPEEAKIILNEALEKVRSIVEKENERKSMGYPKRGTPYWTFQSNGRGITCLRWFDEKVDKFLHEIGEVFKSEDEALFALEIAKVRAKLERLSNAKPSDFYKKFNPFHLEYYQDEVCVRQTSGEFVCGSDFYFKTAHDAMSAVNVIGADRLKKYYFGM